MHRTSETQKSTTAVSLSTAVGNGRLWIGIWGGGIVWTIHFLSVALIAEWGCLSGWYEWQMLGVTGVAWAIILVTLLLSILAMTVTYFSFVVLQESKRASVENSVHDLYDQPGNRHLLAYTGLITSLVFLLTILVQSVPILFYLSEC